VYATSASTPLYFAQAIGRFVRARRPGETASVFLPSVTVLLDLASQLEAQRDHVLGRPHRVKEGFDDDLLVDANRQKDEQGEEEKAFVSLGAEAELDQVIYDGSSFGTATFAGSDEEADYLGLPGLLDAEQMRALLRQRQADQVNRASEQEDSASAEVSSHPSPEVPSRVASAGALASLRKELNSLVAMHHYRTGKPHATVHSELRSRLGGPPIAMATAEQLQDRINALRKW
ncbi:MAG: ATP-dependent helicase, partial [Mycobacteriaceae bacterium]